MNNLKLGVRLTLGFAIVLALTVAIGVVGFISLKNVANKVELSNESANIVELVLGAQNAVRQFQVNGFTVAAGEDKNGADAARDLLSQIVERGEALLAQVGEKDAELLQPAKEHAVEFDAAVVSLAAARQEKDAAFAEWGKLGEAITAEINNAQQEVTAPGMEKARAANDFDALSKWSELDDLLGNRVMNAYLMMRVRAVYLIATNADAQWTALQEQVTDVRAAVAELSEAAQGEAALEAAATKLADYVEQYAKAGDRYYAAILTDRKAVAATNDAAAEMQASLDAAHAALLAEADAAQSRAVALISGFGLLAILIGVAMAVINTSSITKPVAQVRALAEQVVRGNLRAQVALDQKDEIGDLAKALGRVMQALSAKEQVAIELAGGNVGVDVPLASEDDSLGVAMTTMRHSIRGLVAEANRLTEAAVAGKLDTRGDAAQFEGGFRDIVQGVNATLDAVIGPLNVAAEYVERIARGNIPARITESYQGDFNEIKNNLNTCIDAVNALIADANLLT